MGWIAFGVGLLMAAVGLRALYLAQQEYQRSVKIMVNAEDTLRRAIELHNSAQLYAHMAPPKEG